MNKNSLLLSQGRNYMGYNPMAWTEEQIINFKTDNNKMLSEINLSLRSDSLKGAGKIGIFCPGQIGDMATAMSVLKYRKELWGDKEIIWYCNYPNADLLRYAPISEVRPWPWAGNGLPEGCPDFYPLLCDQDNKLNYELSKQFDLTRDLSAGYFPAPYMMSPEKRHGIDYPNCSRKVFGIGMDREWHPVLSWSKDEEIPFPANWSRKTIMIETFCGSGQSKWDDLMTVKTMEICREAWGSCHFYFPSHKNTEQFKDFEGYISLAKYTPREVATFINRCDLFVGISSGISVVTSAWGLKPVPKIQYCGSYTCSTVALSTGEISLITSDDKPLEQSKNEYYTKLKEVISRIK